MYHYNKILWSLKDFHSPQRTLWSLGTKKDPAFSDPCINWNNLKQDMYVNLIGIWNEMLGICVMESYVIYISPPSYIIATSSWWINYSPLKIQILCYTHNHVDMYGHSNGNYMWSFVHSQICHKICPFVMVIIRVSVNLIYCTCGQICHFEGLLFIEIVVRFVSWRF